MPLFVKFPVTVRVPEVEVKVELAEMVTVPAVQERLPALSIVVTLTPTVSVPVTVTLPGLVGVVLVVIVFVSVIESNDKLLNVQLVVSPATDVPKFLAAPADWVNVAPVRLMVPQVTPQATLPLTVMF